MIAGAEAPPERIEQECKPRIIGATPAFCKAATTIPGEVHLAYLREDEIPRRPDFTLIFDADIAQTSPTVDEVINLTGQQDEG